MQLQPAWHLRHRLPRVRVLHLPLPGLRGQRPELPHQAAVERFLPGTETGLTDNGPIREVRERCNADVVIAINVGSPLLPPEQVSGIFSVAALMVALLTELNVSASLATLQVTDIDSQPDLGTITAGDFDRHAEAAERGRAAAEQVVDSGARWPSTHPPGLCGASA